MSDKKFQMWVCQKKTSNKWWTYEVNGNTVVSKFGRIGQKGQRKPKTFADSYERDKFIRAKIWEKEGGKGYLLVSKENFNLLTLQAEIMGSGNKIEKTAIILEQPGGRTYNYFVEVPTAAAYDPNLELGIMITFRLRDRLGATPVYTLMFRSDDVYELDIGASSRRRRAGQSSPKGLKFTPNMTYQGTASKIDNSHPLASMVEKLQEVLGTTL